jgi:hypothetical protein
VCHAREQDRMHVPREARVQFAERIAIPRLCGPDDRDMVTQKLLCSLEVRNFRPRLYGR